MTTAVVILNYNGVELMKQYLPSVVNNTPDAEIIVADNGSTDGFRGVAERGIPHPAAR